VCIEDRLDPVKQRGILNPRLRGKGDYEGDLRKVPCNVSEEHIGASQIFPLIKTENWYTPTIKHHCPRTAVAASLRACSNRVTYDRMVMRRFQTWFRAVFIPKFTKYLDEETVEVDFETWLKRFNLNYQQGMRRAIDPDHISHNDECATQYEAFAKVELQFTTVPHYLKDTCWNDVKERQICGPSDEKKVYGNAFINVLEGVASKYMKEYCGRANWIEICKSLDDAALSMKKLIWGESDGSGFDMTQLQASNKLLNELLTACANHPNVTWNEPLSKHRFIEIITNSLLLNVSVDKGDLKYQADGRASGDGWTTFGNTILMIAYWEFTFHIAGITKYILKVKGDDVLFGINDEDRASLEDAIKVVFTKTKDYQEHGLGQICKKIVWGDITDLSFLSNQFFRTSDGSLRMTRIPARVIQTISWSTKVPVKMSEEVQLKARKELCHSKGMCLKAWADGLPIFSVLADTMIRLGKEGKMSDYNQYADADRVWHKNRDDSDAYKAYLSDHYGVTDADIQEFEDKLRKLDSLSGMIAIAGFEKFYHPQI